MNTLKMNIKGLILGMAMCCMAGMGLRAQKVIDTWSFSTGVDTTLWYDISGVDSMLIAPGNKTSARSALVDIGFDFTLGETTHSQFSTNINGTVSLGSALIPASGYYSQPLGTQGNINIGPKIEPLGWRGRFDNTCYTRKALLGSVGNRVLVIETRMKDYGHGLNDSLYVSFQVQLFEAGGLRVVYGEADSGALTHTMQNGVSANRSTSSTSEKDIVFIDFATHEAERFSTLCDLTNAADTWPEKGRWYGLAYDSTLCPCASAMTASSTNPANVILQNPDGGTIHVMIPAMGIDTIWTGSALNLGGGFNPATTYQGTVQKVCDSNMSLRLRSFSFTTGCGPVVHLPWVSEFVNDLNCWDASQYSYSSYRWRWSYGYAVSGGYAGSNQYDEWLISPVLNLPNDDGLVLKFLYRAGDDQQNRSNTVDVRVAPCTAAGVVDSADWTTVMTLTGEYSNSIARRVFLDAWRGQTVKVAFVLTSVGGNGAYIDRVELLQEQEPVATLSAPTLAHTGENTTLTAHYVTGVTTGLTYIWHSSLLDTTIATTDTIFTIVYPSAGTDTVTLVVSNAYGADTLTATYLVADCPAVTTLPWTDPFYGNIDCWTVPAGSNWKYLDCSSPSVIFNKYICSSSSPVGADNWIISRDIVIPAYDTINVVLEWGEAAYSPGSYPYRYSVLVTTATDPLNSAAVWDTLYSVDSASLVYNSNQAHFTKRQVDISPYAGQTIRVAFRHQPFHIDIYQGQQRLCIDNVTVRETNVPVITLTAPTQVENHDTVTYTVNLIEGFPCNYSWHSTLLDTAIVSSVSVVSFVYPVGGTDTVKVIATNAFGSDTAVAVVTVTNCPPIATLPWLEDFNAVVGTNYNVVGALPDCWRSYWNGSNAAYAPHVIGSYPYTPISGYVSSNQRALMLLSGVPGQNSLDGIDSVAIVEGPVVALPLNQHRLSFYYMQESASRGTLSVGYMQYGDFVSVADMQPQVAGSTDTVSLAAFPANVHRFALRWTQGVASWFGVVVDNIRLLAFDTLPTVQIGTPVVHGGDSVHFRAWLADGLDDSLTYTWSSSMAAAGQATLTAMGDSACIVYTALGTDTVSVIATTAYGADTAQLLYTYPGAPDGVISGPTSVHSDDTLTFTAYLWSGSITGLSYSWHSTMAAAGQATMVVTGDTLRMVYLAGGTDTLTLITTNAFGTDTDRRIVTVTDCEPITQLPYTVRLNSNNNITCWQKDGGWYIGDYFSSGITCMQCLNWDFDPVDNWLVMREIAIPDDYTQSYTLRWHMQCNHSKYQVMVSTQGRSDHSLFDTLYYEQNDSTHWTSRTLSLDAYRGQNIYIAFRNLGWYNSPAHYSDMGVFRIDTIQVLVSSDPQTYRTLTLDVNDPTMGSVSGAGVYPDSSDVTISATPFEGYHFVAWNDNDTCTVRTLTLVSDTAFTAYFAADTLPTPPPDTLWRTVAVTANVDGVCETYGSGTYADSSRVEMGYTMVDTVNEGGRWQFLGWSDGENDNPRTILVTSDTVIVALFEWMADSVGINELRDNSYEIRVYPNPAHGAVTVSVGAPATLTVLDLTGRVVVAPLSLSSSATLPFTDLPSGTYFLRVTTEEGTAVKKLIVK